MNSNHRSSLRDGWMRICFVVALFGAGCDQESGVVAKQVVKNFDGTLFEIASCVYQPRRYGHPDIFQLGEKRKTQHTFYPLTNQIAKWSGPFRPICLHHMGDRFFLVALDANNPNKAVFRYYSFTTNWIETGKDAYPKQMAIQNLSLTTSAGYDRSGMPIDEASIVSAMDVSNVYFRMSLTAHLWEGLVKRTEYYETAGNPVDTEVLRTYRTQFIEGLRGVSPQGASRGQPSSE